ncbi:protein of unknown function [Modestobacter italicus]|uniref:Uncharacterized protein n=1 Tax=Modestobacter italicus (strain DSM 44449 / CECT 9708 / BC 501) TaxID=2732864 RepID=I4EXG0_MODI5|nr:protein of unknown function [Modestobacter marinus]
MFIEVTGRVVVSQAVGPPIPRAPPGRPQYVTLTEWQ